jgi:hypothetical protein
MNKKVVAVLLVALGPVWFHLAYQALGHGKGLIAVVQAIVGLAFVARGVVEWRKASQST